MTRSPRIHARLFAAMLAALVADPALAGPTLTLSIAVGHPKASVNVSGTGFTPNEAIDVYFDTTDTQLVFADDSGKFSARKVKVPADAVPGAHWISAVGRKNGDGSQKTFTVRTDWPEFGFDERGKRTNGFENVLDTNSARSLDLLWKSWLGAQTHSSPTVAKGIAYIGANGGKLHAIVAATGVEKWTATTGNDVYSPPTVSDGVVYIGSVDGKLYAFNAYTGAPKWSVPAPGFILCAPTVVNGVVYVGTANRTVNAFDAATGAQLWSQPTAASVFSSPAVVGGTVYIGSDDGKLYAYDAVSGAPKWNFVTGARVYSSPAVANGMVYVGSADGHLYALDTAGNLVWSVSMGQVFASPAIANNTVYIGDYDGNFRAFNATNGAVLWTTNIGALIASSAAVANGVVYVGSNASGRIYALDAATGAILWSALDGDLAGTSPAVVNGIVYVGSYEGNLYAYAIDGGRNAVYHHSPTAPSYAALHPDFSLKPAH